MTLIYLATLCFAQLFLTAALVPSSHFKSVTRSFGIALNAQKFDPDSIVTVRAKKPLGATLVENEEGGKLGVCIDEINEGSLKESGVVRKGLYLLTINEKDVRYEDFDTIIDTIVDAPEDQPLKLEFIDPRTVQRGPAILTVDTPDGLQREIAALKGQMLRTVLQENGVEVYAGKAKWTNCGGAGNCGTCAVEVTDNEFWEARPRFEALRLKKYGENARLSCNTVIEGDCTVKVQPPKN